MSLTTTNRNLKDLNELVKVLLELAINDIKEQGINPLVVETYRSQDRQNYLYCQGRTIDECVAKGIKRAFAAKHCNPNVKKVTWTLNSIHKARKAVDIIPQRIINSKMTAIWDSNDKETKKIINTMKNYGFDAGADWKSSPDSPHFQIDGKFTTYFSKDYNTVYVTKMIQAALNKKMDLDLVVDGKWGNKTSEALIMYRKKMKFKNVKAIIGAGALKQLLMREID